MSFFFSKKATPQYRLIVAIEPNSIGLGLTLVDSTELQLIDRKYIAYSKRPSMKHMQSKLSVLLREMLNKSILPKLAGARIASITCIHSSAWSIAETHTVDLHFEKPMKILEKIIIDSVHSHRSGKVAENLSNNLDLVYHHIQKVKLNGYYTDVPWGKIAQTASCDLIEGYIDTMMKTFCENELLRYANTLTHIPEGFIALNAARNVNADLGEALIIHIGGETTEIIYADKNYLRQTASAPMGIATLVRASAEFVHNDQALALSHILMFAKGVRIPTKKEHIAIKSCIETWSKEFIKAVHAACGNNVPEHIYYFSSLPYAPIAEHLLNPQEISKWSGNKHETVQLFGKNTFQHDFMIAAGAIYVVE